MKAILLSLFISLSVCAQSTLDFLFYEECGCDCELNSPGGTWSMPDTSSLEFIYYYITNDDAGLLLNVFEDSVSLTMKNDYYYDTGIPNNYTWMYVVRQTPYTEYALIYEYGDPTVKNGYHSIYNGVLPAVEFDRLGTQSHDNLWDLWYWVSAGMGSPDYFPETSTLNYTPPAWGRIELDCFHYIDDSPFLSEALISFTPYRNLRVNFENDSYSNSTMRIYSNGSILHELSFGQSQKEVVLRANHTYSIYMRRVWFGATDNFDYSCLPIDVNGLYTSDGNMLYTSDGNRLFAKP